MALTARQPDYLRGENQQDSGCALRERCRCCWMAQSVRHAAAAAAVASISALHGTTPRKWSGGGSERLLEGVPRAEVLLGHCTFFAMDVPVGRTQHESRVCEFWYKRPSIRRGARSGPKSHQPRSLAAVAAIRIAIRRILLALNAAKAPEHMNIPGFRFHPYGAEIGAGMAVDASGNGRITFGWDSEDAVDVDLEDYH